MNARFFVSVGILSMALRLDGQQTGPKPVIVAAPAGPVPAPQTPGASGTPPAPGAAVAPPDSARYIISPEDTVQVTVWKEPSFSGSIPVRPDGMISLSLVGDLPAAGMTPMQLSTDIASRLKKFINDPSVTVTVMTVRPKQVYLLGEVAHIGPVPLTPGMSVLQVIAAAGGLSPFAKSKNMYILRGDPGHEKKIPFNYKKALKEGDEQGVALIAGDTIVVP
jgi:polysaccharide export outer membrane protein